MVSKGLLCLTVPVFLSDHQRISKNQAGNLQFQDLCSRNVDPTPRRHRWRPTRWNRHHLHLQHSRTVVHRRKQNRLTHTDSQQEEPRPLPVFVPFPVTMGCGPNKPQFSASNNRLTAARRNLLEGRSEEPVRLRLRPLSGGLQRGFMASLCSPLEAETVTGGQQKVLGLLLTRPRPQEASLESRATSMLNYKC